MTFYIKGLIYAHTITKNFLAWCLGPSLVRHSAPWALLRPGLPKAAWVPRMESTRSPDPLLYSYTSMLCRPGTACNRCGASLAAVAPFRAPKTVRGIRSPLCPGAHASQPTCACRCTHSGTHAHPSQQTSTVSGTCSVPLLRNGHSPAGALLMAVPLPARARSEACLQPCHASVLPPPQLPPVPCALLRQQDAAQRLCARAGHTRIRALA